AGARVRGHSLRWHVVPSNATRTTARLGFSRQLYGPLDAISLHVKNPNGHDLGLRLELIDADGVRYLSPTVALGDELGWRELIFDLAQMRPEPGAEDVYPGPDLPIVWMQIVIGPLIAGRSYTIYLDEITAHSFPRPQVTVEALNAPPSVGPGERIPCAARLHFARPPSADTRLFAELQWRGATLARSRVDFSNPSRADDTVQARAEALVVPAWLPPGRYQVALTSPDLTLSGPGDALAPIVVGGPVPDAPAARIDIGEDAPALVTGDRRLTPRADQVFAADTRQVRRSDSEILVIAATTDSHPFGWAPDVSSAGGELDFTGMDRRLGAVLAARPDARLLVQVFMDASSDWAAAHRDQLMTFGGETIAPPAMWGRRRVFPDLISGKWAGDAHDRLKTLVEHVEASPCGHRVIGYELLAGDLGAWRPWGASLNLGDETPPLRQAAWRSFLVGKYHNFSALRSAWGLPPVPAPGAPPEAFTGPTSWEQIVVPQRRRNLTYPALYDPASNGAWIDMNNFRAQAPARLIKRMAAVMKEATDGRKLVGVCYGHLLAQSEGAWRWPHLALSELLACDDLDFLTGPLWAPGPAPVPDFPVRSALKTGKLWLRRTRAAGTDAPHLELAAPAPVREPSSDDLVVILDDVSARYLRRDGGLVYPLFAGQLDELAELGVPWRLHTMADLLAGDVPPARAWLFLDAFRLNREERVQIVDRLCRDHNLLIWVYAPGAVDTHMLSGRTMKNLTGIKLSFTTTPGPLRVRVPANSPLLDEHMAEGLQFGVGECFPLFFSADDRADRMGALMGTDFVGLAVREYSNCVMAYSAAPAVPAEILRGLLRRAGIGD
ncbi:MAG: hypothetical protein J7M38_06760, partial [Armatimonadetes bacterium]|nr:hypothetical protein [Armatimonadota bacterium]